MESEEAPFEVGERVAPIDLRGWTYAGLSGVPDKDEHATRRFKKGIWVLELQAFSNKKRRARVRAIRTEDEDRRWWAEQRQQEVPALGGSRSTVDRVRGLLFGRRRDGGRRRSNGD